MLFLSSGFVGKEEWIIDADSRLTIHGSTNINSFSCKMDCYVGGDTLRYVKNSRTYELQPTNNGMVIPIFNFECNTRQISNDFRKTLKAETYPQLNINFRTLQDPSLKNNSCINGIVDITLAGVTKQYTIQFTVINNKGVTQLTGLHPVTFSDFNLEAPEKLSGLIKVKEVLNVEFNLVLRSI